ncbi:50S ribosomal protein L29 [Candidatus Nomurabacteria bacterium RIFCSPHIGHO2_02_FULL_33_12]|uniref:Large ribosomal subunit protein uL29 n=1 Tax=Candidatus Nomurabacteria bacterium RIFCSPLOWO2_01_FULL_33_17 TaxID=1801764 RepID=A0A1F6WQD2_9BACT|nr:MAG: 50S ribosomal protein L29 [Candidatus Nomurabacteria bacterium RIFCSPHIGHO2_02_FULL_33_12]OGI84024.1 MAG: 50S ribosomal protein L29 [Candidatus Nomurabacteria bacterium RIFCSPLOWO2_01_FULL_33_17]
MKHKKMNLLSADELKSEILSKEKEIRTIKFSVAGVTNKNTKTHRDARKTIARAKTQLRAELG